MGMVCAFFFFLFFWQNSGMFKTFSADFHLIGESWLVKLTGKAVGKRLNVIYPAGLSFKRTNFPVLLQAVTHCTTLERVGFLFSTSFSSPPSFLSACTNYRHIMQRMDTSQMAEKLVTSAVYPLLLSFFAAVNNWWQFLWPGYECPLGSIVHGARAPHFHWGWGQDDLSDCLRLQEPLPGFCGHQKWEAQEGKTYVVL